MKKQIVIVGLGRFGVSLANTLARHGHEVLALDMDEHTVQSVTPQITHAVRADATDETVLHELGVRNFDVAIVAIGSDIQSSVLATVLLKGLGIPCIVARANNKSHGEILKKIGADRVVFPEDEMGNRVAHELELGNVTDYLPVTPRYGITIIGAEQESIGRTLAELGFGPKGQESIAVLIIQRGNEFLISPRMSETVKSGDRLILAGTDDRLENLLSRLGAIPKGK